MRITGNLIHIPTNSFVFIQKLIIQKRSQQGKRGKNEKLITQKRSQQGKGGKKIVNLNKERWV
jgi:hypothetical protein